METEVSKRVLVSVDDFLQKQSEDGVDSTGEFTVALDKAAWKLASYRLANRHDAALHLLSCAVAGCATYFRARLTATEIQFEFDGQAFTERDLLSLSGNAPSDRSVRLQELEIALSAAAAFDLVCFSTVGPESGHSLLLKNGDVKLSSAPRRSEPRSLLSIRTDKGDPYLNALRARAAHAPLQLSLHWKTVSQPVDGELETDMTLARLYVQGRERLLLAPESAAPRLNLTRAEQDSPTLLLYLLDPRCTKGGVLHFQSYGVELESETQPTLPPFLWGVVTVGHLKKDLGQKSLLQDATWEDFRRWIKQQIDSFLCEVCTSDIEIPGEGIFRDRLSRYYGGDAPAQIKNYLSLYQGGKEMSTSPRHYEALIATARETGDWRLCDRILTSLERELYFQWMAHDVELQTLERLEKFTNLSGRQPERFLGLDCCLRYFHGRRPSDFQLQELPGSLGRYSQARFRTALLQLPVPETETWLKNLTHIPGLDGWKALLRFFFSTQSQGPRDGLFFPLSRIRDGEFRDIASVFPRFDDAPQTSEERALWQYLVLNLIRGKVGWLTEIRLRARVSLKYDLRSDQKRVYFSALENYANGTLDEFDTTTELGTPPQVFAYLCYARCRGANFNTESGQLFLSQFLLAESFRGPEQLLSLSARMADLPFAR